MKWRVVVSWALVLLMWSIIMGVLISAAIIQIKAMP